MGVRQLGFWLELLAAQFLDLERQEGSNTMLFSNRFSHGSLVQS